MWERLYEQQQAVTTALCLLGKNNFSLEDEDWTTVKETLDALKPSEEATREVSADQYVTISKIIPLVGLLQRSAGGQINNPLASHLLAQYRRRLQNTENI